MKKYAVNAGVSLKDVFMDHAVFQHMKQCFK